MSQQVTYEQLVLAEVRRRETTDYRFSYWTYLGWTILTFGIYSAYGTYKLVERRHLHAQRRLAFQSYLWHALNARAEALGKKEEVQEGLDNLSRIYQQMEAFERRNKREPVLWMILRLVVTVVGAYINHFLNKDLRFYDEWEASFAANTEWVMSRLGYPVQVPQRRQPVRDRSTGLYVLLSIVTLGISTLYWRYVTMMDGNGHFDDDAAVEDALIRGLGIEVEGAMPPPAAPAGPPAPPV
ncbi:MAG TPA: DUF4234 domain-containing protein [Actinomycetota bacterium]|nr:DUF4234 domain-containing protein [Actinomycetota bacterium]